jgi:hypothetical protein
VIQVKNKDEGWNDTENEMFHIYLMVYNKIQNSFEDATKVKIKVNSTLPSLKSIYFN